MLEVIQMFCQDCKVMVDVKDAKEEDIKNGRRIIKGHCPNCNAELFKRRT